MPPLIDSGISVDIIDAPDYNAFSQCVFYTKDNKTLVQSVGPGDSQHIVVGPPQPIVAVSCLGMCVPTYGEFIPVACVGLWRERNRRS